MSAADRSAWRNAHIYDAKNPATALGGLLVTNGVTNANFYSMVEIICISDTNFFLRDDSELVIQKDEQALQPGSYYIVTSGSITLTDEVPLLRTISLQSGTCVAAFRDAVRERDRRCIITGELVLLADYNFWTGFETAHIFRD